MVYSYPKAPVWCSEVYTGIKGISSFLLKTLYCVVIRGHGWNGGGREDVTVTSSPEAYVHGHRGNGGYPFLTCSKIHSPSRDRKVM